MEGRAQGQIAGGEGRAPPAASEWGRGRPRGSEPRAGLRAHVGVGARRALAWRPFLTSERALALLLPTGSQVGLWEKGKGGFRPASSRAMRPGRLWSPGGPRNGPPESWSSVLGALHPSSNPSHLPGGDTQLLPLTPGPF